MLQILQFILQNNSSKSKNPHKKEIFGTALPNDYSKVY